MNKISRGKSGRKTKGKKYKENRNRKKPDLLSLVLISSGKDFYVYVFNLERKSKLSVLRHCVLCPETQPRNPSTPNPPGEGPHLTVRGQAGIIERSLKEPNQQILHLTQAVALTEESLLQDPQAGYIFGRVKA